MIRESKNKIIAIVFLLFIYKYFNGILIRKISVAYGLNNKYFLQTYISIISILENSFPKTFYKFYLLINKKFKKGNKAILHNLEEKYKNCKFFYCNINTKIFSNIFIKRKKKYPKETFYRLLIANYIPDDRVIYLDGDTMIFSDLGEMYNLKMGDNYILGFADRGFKYIDVLGINDYKYITAGVLLIDLKNFRKQNITEKFIDYMNNNKDRLIQNDQTVINVVLKKNIGFLPPKYGIWNFKNEAAVLNYSNSLKKKYDKDIYDKHRFLSAFKNPTIVHYVYRKPWLNQKKIKNKFFHEKWWNLKKIYNPSKKTKSSGKK